MPVLSLQEIALENLTVKDACGVNEITKSVLIRVLLKRLRNPEGNTMNLFVEMIMQNERHICRLRNFDVWHGINIGPRKFRKKITCKCECARLGHLCECNCNAIFKMMIEYREAEVFRGYTHGQRRHKKARRFIAKTTRIRDILRDQFRDPHPYYRL